MSPAGFWALALLLVQAGTSAAAFSVPVLTPEIARDLAVDPAALGFYSGLMFAVGSLSSSASGAVIERWGPVRVSQLCLIASAVGLLAATHGALALFVLGAALLGLGFGPETPASSALLARVAPPHRRSVIFSLKQTGNQVGGMAVSLALPLSVPLLGWRGSLWLVVGACFVVALLLDVPRRAYAAAAAPAVAPARPRFGEALRIAARDPRLVRLGLASFSFSGMQLALNAFLVSYGVAELGMSLVEAGVMLFWAQAAGFVGRVLWGWIADRFVEPRRLLIALGCIMSAAAFAVASFTPSWPGLAIVAVAAAFGLTASGWNGVFLAEVARLAPPGRAGDVTGAVLLVAYGGLVISPLAFAAIVAATRSYGTAFAGMAALTLVTTSALAVPPISFRDRSRRTTG